MVKALVNLCDDCSRELEDKVAHYICAICGKAICDTHARRAAIILELFTDKIMMSSKFDLCQECQVKVCEKKQDMEGYFYFQNMEDITLHMIKVALGRGEED